MDDTSDAGGARDRTWVQASSTLHCCEIGVRGVMRERNLPRTQASPRRVPLPARMQDQTTQTTARAYLASTTPSSVVMSQVTAWQLLLCTCSKCQIPATQKEETRAGVIHIFLTRGSHSYLLEIRRAQALREFLTDHFAFEFNLELARETTVIS